MPSICIAYNGIRVVLLQSRKSSLWSFFCGRRFLSTHEYGGEAVFVSSICFILLCFDVHDNLRDAVFHPHCSFILICDTIFSKKGIMG